MRISWIDLLGFCFVASLPAHAGVPALSFNSPREFAANHKPGALAEGDFNGDGYLDLAVADTGNGSVTILLGGNGAFTTGATYVVGPVPDFVVAADFNGDGKLDLAVAIQGTGEFTFKSIVTILLGNGDGTFRAPVKYEVGTEPNWIAVGDFNGDGHLDLAVNSVDSATVSILLGNGNGTFQPAHFYDAGPASSAVVTGDFNGDGILDLAATDAEGGLSVLIGNGDGTFQPPITTLLDQAPVAPVVADFNGDGKLDVAAVYRSSSFSDVVVLLGNGDGTFRPPQTYGPVSCFNTCAMIAADFRADGK